MLGAVEPDLSCAIDPQLKWRTSSNGKQRALRRARNFMQGKDKDGNKFIFKNNRAIKDPSTEISEKEEFGVSILGRRFSDSLESVPIKKRRFSLLHSHSAPHLFLSSDFHDQNHGGHLTLFQSNKMSYMQDKSDIDHFCGSVGWGEEKCFDDEKRNSDDISELKDDSADFSGISILAAAACYSSIEKGFTDAENSTNKMHSFEEKPPLLLFSKTLESKDEPSPREHIKIKPKPLAPSTSGKLIGFEPVQVKSDKYKGDNSASLQNFLSKQKFVSSHDDRLHWDLNTIMDVWEGQSDDLPSEIHGTEYANRTVFANADKEDASRQCFEEVDRKHISNVSQALLSKSSQDEKANAYFSEGNADLDRELSTKIVSLPKEEGYDLDNAIPQAITGIATLGQSMDSSHKIFCDQDLSITHADTCTDKSADCPEEFRSLSVAVSVCIDSQQSHDGQHDQNVSGIKIHGEEKSFQTCLDENKSKNVAKEGCLADENKADTDEVGNSFAKDNQPTALINLKGIADNKQLLSRNACVNQIEECCTDLKVNGNKSCFSGTEKWNSSASLLFNISSNFEHSMPEGVIFNRNVISSADDKELFLQVKGVRRMWKDSLEEPLDSEEHSNACPFNTEFGTELEKIEFVGDDDSQYEDGELRESILNSWEEDGVEEVEIEHVDYGSDCREADFFESESNCSYSDLAIGTIIDCKSECNFVSSSVDGDQLPITDGDHASNCFQKCYLTKDVNNPSDCVENDRQNLVVDIANELLVVDDKTSNKSTNTNNAYGKSSQSAEQSRIKVSGWDKLPKSVDAAVNVLWNRDVSFATCNSEHLRRLDVSSVKSGLPKASDNSYRKEFSYAMLNRKNNHIDLDAVRSTISRRSIGRSRLFSHAKIAADSWIGPSDHRGGYFFDTSEYCLPSNSEISGSRNATAAAVAKVESNGFVVEPDGTIVKAGSIVSGIHVSGRPSKSSSTLNTRRAPTIEDDEAFAMSSEACSFNRESSPGRCFNSGRGRGSKPRHGSGPVSFGPRNRHHAPMFDRRMDTVSLRKFSSRRQQSFSPQKRPIHISYEHTRSSSRSKTRSPNSWASPRERDDRRIIGGHDGRRQSRSLLNYRTLRRTPRQRSPQQSTFFAEESSAYDSSSRNHSSPRHASRWFHNERFLQCHFQKQPRCSIWRNSHVNRVKPCDYNQPIPSGRFHEVPNYVRGSMRDGRPVDRRGKSNRYQMIHSEEHLECTNNSIRAGNAQSKFFGFQSEGSPRRFKEEMAYFRTGIKR